jgi:hypothetical protein
VLLALMHCTFCWLQDLKRVLKKAGLEGRDTVFLFSDTQIVQEGFLEDLNNILNAGEAPCLKFSSSVARVGTASSDPRLARPLLFPLVKSESVQVDIMLRGLCSKSQAMAPRCQTAECKACIMHLLACRLCTCVCACVQVTCPTCLALRTWRPLQQVYGQPWQLQACPSTR